ncbi:putative endoribonuclease L-PSP [Shewanella halifaxensis HAW-EB4]|uniref:Endoribonuclease L-PSP n=1 Tax=Shewanella halifaxensis (strain HAW-EB4) TaxID=458817 RepID=B0TM60_SHEHH|nr:RidA family protein [Shewanella halifaxensis]ABZ74653.1 putative endoribonuclease L-PSP [Shewanella halifaxensis HAW-EB4]
MTKALNTESAPAAIGPYVQGVDLGSMIFTSGQLPIDPATGEMSADVAEQALQSLKNVQAIVESAGLTMANVFKMTVFVKDLNNFPIVNEVYQNFFDQLGASYPARSCVEVARLPKDAQIEIEAIAVRS